MFLHFFCRAIKKFKFLMYKTPALKHVMCPFSVLSLKTEKIFYNFCLVQREITLINDFDTINLTGEVMSFYLSRLLGMDSVPAVLLAVTNQTSSRWSNVDIASVQWQNGKVVALIQWTSHMESVK